MVSILLLLIGFVIVNAVPCGEYTTKCKAAGPIFVQYTFVITGRDSGYAKKIVQIERQYTDSSCKRGHYLTFETTLTPKLKSVSNNQYDDYDLTYKSVKMTVEDESRFSSLGFSCDSSVREGKAYSLTDLSCEQAKLPYTTLYKESIGTTVESVHLYYGDEKIWFMDMEAIYNGMNGCTTKITVVVIVCIIGLLVGAVLICMLCCRKKEY